MLSNVVLLNSHVLLVTLAKPINVNECLDAVKRIGLDQALKQNLSFDILIDATHIQTEFTSGEIEHLQQLFLGLTAYGPVAVFGFSHPISTLIKLPLSTNDIANFPVYFRDTQKDAMAALDHLHKVNNFATSLDEQHGANENNFPSFRNCQTEQMFRAFTASPVLYSEWRELVNDLYEDGAIAFETLMFAKLHEFGDTNDLSIDWDAIIMALLYDVDL